MVESLSAPESFKTPLNKALMNRLLGAITNCLGMDKIKYEVFIQLSFCGDRALIGWDRGTEGRRGWCPPDFVWVSLCSVEESVTVLPVTKCLKSKSSKIFLRYVKQTHSGYGAACLPVMIPWPWSWGLLPPLLKAFWRRAAPKCVFVTCLQGALISSHKYTWLSVWHDNYFFGGFSRKTWAKTSLFYSSEKLHWI